MNFSKVDVMCYGDQIPCLLHICFRTILKHSTSHIVRGVALAAQAATPASPRVYSHPSISDSRNDHSSFYATLALRLESGGVEDAVLLVLSTWGSELTFYRRNETLPPCAI